MSYADDNLISIDYEDMMLHSSDDWDSEWLSFPTSEILWECKDGTVLALAEMKTYHIKNCIDMIKRSIRNNTPWRIEYLNPLQKELNKRQEK